MSSSMERALENSSQMIRPTCALFVPQDAYEINQVHIFDFVRSMKVIVVNKLTLQF